jgi:hypothetical protein
MDGWSVTARRRLSSCTSGLSQGAPSVPCPPPFRPGAVPVWPGKGSGPYGSSGITPHGLGAKPSARGFALTINVSTLVSKAYGLWAATYR